MANNTIATLLIKLVLDTKGLMTGLTAVEKNLKNTQNKFADFGKTVSNVFKIAATGYATKELVSKTAEFEKELAKLSVVSKTSGEDLKKLGNTAQKMGLEFGVSSNEIVKGLTEMSRLGFETAKSLEIMPDLLRFTKANTADFTTTIGLAEATLNDFNLQLDQLPNTLDIFTVALSKGQLNMENLRQTFKRSSPIAYGAGIRIEELAASTSILARAAFKGEQAGRALNRIMSELTNPSKKTNEQLSKMGVVLKNSTNSVNPFTENIEMLSKKMKTLTGEERVHFAQLAVGRDHYDKFLALLDTAPGTFENLVHEMETASGSTKSFFEVLSQTIGVKLDQIKSGFTSLTQKLGTELAPLFSLIADKAIHMIDVLMNLDWEQIGTNIKDELLNIEDAFDATVQAITGTMEYLKTEFQSMWDFIANIFDLEESQVAQDWSEFWMGLQFGASSAIKIIVGIIAAGVKAIGGLFTAFKQFAHFEWEAGWETLKATGSSVAGTITNTYDSIANDLDKGRQRLESHRARVAAQQKQQNADINRKVFGPTFGMGSTSNTNNTFNMYSSYVDGRHVKRTMDRAAWMGGLG